MTNLKALATSIAVALSSGLLLSSGIALADSVSNTLDGSVDASLEVMNLTEGGVDGAASYSIAASDGDGVDGCNLSSALSLTVNVQSSNTAVATVTPASLTFTNCTDIKTVSVKPIGAGHAEITLAQTANTSAGFFNLSGSAFVAIVADVPPPDTTAPVIAAHLSPEPNAAGWNNSNVTLSWTVTDAESAILSKTGCDTTVQSTGTNGTVYTCSATSAGGTSSKSVTIMLDKAAPSIVITSPKNGAEYELDQEVKASWSATDNRSGVATAVGTKASGEMIDTSTLGEHTFTVTATDKAGNARTLTVKYTVELKDDDDDDKDHGRNRVTICHKGKHSITLSAAALKAHLKHGDTVDKCNNDGGNHDDDHDDDDD